MKKETLSPLSLGIITRLIKKESTYVDKSSGSNYQIKKRDNKSKTLKSNDITNKKDSTDVDTKPGSNCQDIRNSKVVKDTRTEIVDILDDILEIVNLSEKNSSHEHRVTNLKMSLNLIGGGEEEGEGGDTEPDSEEEEDENVTVKEESTFNEKSVNSKNSLFTTKQWGEDEDNADPAGINFKSKMSGFVKAAEVLRKEFRKGSIKKIGDMKAHVEEVKRKGTGTELNIKVTDSEGEGEVKLSFWGPNKKTKETTIQINIKKGNEKRHVKQFAEIFIKENIDKIVNGKGREHLFEKQEAKVLCTVCQKTFAKEASLKIHMKSHFNCSKCGQGFKKEQDLESHKLKAHSGKEKPHVTNTLSEESIQTCEDCGHIALSRKSLMIHIEKEHIEDSWLVNTKREANMMNSDQESLKTKTEEPQVKRLKINEPPKASLSDIMDQKILQKRKIEEERDILWEKEKKKGEQLREEKTNERKSR